LKIYFGVCGIGLGHAGRSIPLARMIQKEGNEVLFSTYLDAVDYVKREKFPLVAAPPINLTVKSDGSVDFRGTAAESGMSLHIFLKQVLSEIRFMKSFKPDVVVSDSRASSILAAKMLDIPEVTLLNQYQVIIPREKRFLRLARIGDASLLGMIGEMWSMGNYVLILDFPKPYTVSLYNLRIPPRTRKKVKIIGPIIGVGPGSLPSKEEIKETLGFGRNPLIFVPISGPVKEKSYLIGVLKEIMRRFPEKYDVVMSLGNPNSTSKPIKNGKKVIYPWLPHRFELLKACDLVIARAGHGTIVQSMYYGKPLILIPTPNQTEQHNNARRAKELGIAKIIPQKKISYDNLLSSVEEILEKDCYGERAEKIQKEISVYNGIENAFEVITSLAKK